MVRFEKIIMVVTGDYDQVCPFTLLFLSHFLIIHVMSYTQ